MQIVNIQDSLVQSFQQLSLANYGSTYPIGTTVGNFVNQNLPCGNANLNNLGILRNSISSNSSKQVNSLASILHISNSSIDSALKIGVALATGAAAIDKIMGGLSSLGIDESNIDKLTISPSGWVNNNTLPPSAIPPTHPVVTGLNDLNLSMSSANALSTAQLAKFQVGNIGSLSIGDINLQLNDPIGIIANVMKCQDQSILGMLSLGLSLMMDTTNSSFNFANPLNSMVSAINNKLNGYTGAAVGFASFANPIINSFVNNIGISSLISTALADSVFGALGVKTLAACTLAQKFNQFNTYDPFINSALQLAGMTLGPSNPNYMQVRQSLGSSMQTGNIDCKCCANESYYINKQSTLNQNASSYMKQTNYINNLPSQFRSSASSAGVDPVSVNIARYGFSQNNLMTQSLGTSLETTRLTSQIIGNLQEVAIQPSKLYILAPFAKLSFNYLNTLNQQSAKQSLGVVDQLLPVMNTLMVV